MEPNRAPTPRPRTDRPAAQRPQGNRNRRRRQRKPPVRALLICAAIVFAAGFLMGFLVRGFFLPKAEQPEQTDGVSQTDSVPQSGGADTAEPPAGTESDPAPAAVEDWRLVLVNRWTPLAEDFTVELTRLSGGAEVDKRCYSDLQNLLAACKEAGHSPAIVTSYVSREDQQLLYDQALQTLLDQGSTAEAAAKTLASQAAEPGYSEHQTGLAVDIVDAMNQNLDSSQTGTEISAWLRENAWKYGFIQRYPEGTSDVTGVAFEPWHYRYVGLEAAAAMHEQGVTLEAYLQSSQ